MKKQKNHIFFLILTVIFLIGIVFLLSKNEGKQETTESVDTELTQYSDKKNDTTPSQVNTESKMKTTLLGAVKRNSNKTCVLNFSLSSNTSSVVQNDQITRTVKIKNQSKVQCLNTTLSLYYSDNETFVSSNPSATASNYYWNIGTLSAGAERTVVVVTRAIGPVSQTVDTEGCTTANGAKDVCVINSTLITSGEIVTTPSPTPPPANLSDKEYGTWVWVSPLQMSESYTRSVVDAAYANGINTIYVTIDDFLEIHALSNELEKEAQKALYSDALETVIRIASEKGIAVDAEAGWRDWAEAGQTYKAFAIVDYVIEYNTTHPSYPLRGLQYDVEPYLLSSYETNKAPILTRFVSLIDETAIRLGSSNLKFNVVIPHFYDDRQAWTPAVTYKGVTQHTFNHLLNILDRRPGSTIILMSYRNFAEGDNGTIQISEVEIEEASSGGHSTKVIVGQETGNVDPSYVTYYGLSKEHYLEQIGIVQGRFAGQSGFGGMAVHYIEPFLELQ